MGKNGWLIYVENIVFYISMYFKLLHCVFFGVAVIVHKRLTSQWAELNTLGNDVVTHAHTSSPKTTLYFVNGREVGGVNYTVRFVSVRSTN